MRETPLEIAIRHASIKAEFEAALPAQMRDRVKIHIQDRRGQLTRVTVRRILRERLEQEGSDADSV